MLGHLWIGDILGKVKEDDRSPKLYINGNLHGVF